MNYPENRRMFTIRELAKACGVSRSTLIRMEECGFLTPCYTDPETGYRYYDAQNAAHVGQFLLLQQLGLTRAEITDCYFQIEKTKEMLQKQRARLFLMQRTLEELEVRVNPAHNFSCSFLDLPETVCYCERQMISSPDESEQFFFSIHEKCISEGFRLMGTEPIFGSHRALREKRPAHCFLPRLPCFLHAGLRGLPGAGQIVRAFLERI